MKNENIKKVKFPTYSLILSLIFILGLAGSLLNYFYFGSISGIITGVLIIPALIIDLIVVVKWVFNDKYHI